MCTIDESYYGSVSYVTLDGTTEINMYMKAGIEFKLTVRVRKATRYQHSYHSLNMRLVPVLMQWGSSRPSEEDEELAQK